MGVKYRLNGEAVTKAEFMKDTKGMAGGAPMVGNHKGWPRVSQAAGVHPSQRHEAAAHAASMGVPTEINTDGDVVFRDRKHQTKFLKAHGMRDNDGGYSD